METDVQLAIEAEKIFNNSNLLLVTFTEDEINTNTFQQLHRSVKNVHVLQPEFFPKRRCIIEVKDLFEIYSVKDVILKHNFENRRVQVTFLEKFNDSYSNLDPYKLQVNNLPSIISPRELKQLYPLSTDYTFLLLESKSRTVLVHFAKVQDAIAAYKTTNFMQYQSNILLVKFYRKYNNSLIERIQKKRSFTEDRDTDFWESSDEENINNRTGLDNNINQKDSSNFDDDDISKWKEIQKNALKDKKISDTLLVQNLPYNITGKEIQQLFPNLYRYKFISDNKTKSCLVRFRKVDEAVLMYTESNNVFKSNILYIDFYDKENDLSFYKAKSIKGEVNNIPDCIVTNFVSNKEKMKKNEKNSRKEEQNDELDLFALHVQNLPSSTSNQDLHSLYPDLVRYEIFVDNNENKKSAYVWFKTTEGALKAYNTTKNILFKRNILSIKFKTKKFQKLNPFALMKQSIVRTVENNEERNKKIKLNCEESQPPDIEEDDDVIIIGDVPGIKLLNEDDIECKSEEEDYIEDTFYVDPDMINGTDNTGDDDDIDDNDIQVAELDDNNVLPLDEDGF